MTPPLPTKFVARPRPSSWHKPRLKRVGASEVAAVFSIGEYEGGTARALWLLKTGRAKPFEGNEATDWGTRVEHIIAKRWARCYMGGIIVRKFQHAVVHPGGVPLAATPDYAVRDLPCLVQVKTANEWNGGKWGRQCTDAIPHPYMLQVQAEMACCPFALWTYVVLQVGSETRTYIVPRSEELIRTIEAAVTRFWGYVERDEIPVDHEHCPIADLRLKAKDCIPSDADVDAKRKPALGVAACIERIRGFPVSLSAI